MRVLVVDEQEVVRCGFRVMLGALPWVTRCLTGASLDEALWLTQRYEPHVALVDRAGEVSAAEVCGALLAARPQLRVVLMARDAVVPAAVAARAGAVGAASKSWSAAAVARTVAAVSAGQTVFSEPGGAVLSAREYEVLELIADGATNREIANRLHLSHNTVKEHASVLYRKLRARNRAEAVRRAQHLGYHFERSEPICQ